MQALQTQRTVSTVSNVHVCQTAKNRFQKSQHLKVDHLIAYLVMYVSKPTYYFLKEQWYNLILFVQLLQKPLKPLCV